jgi:hypothetical protein
MRVLGRKASMISAVNSSPVAVSLASELDLTYTSIRSFLALTYSQMSGQSVLTTISEVKPDEMAALIA